MDPDPGGPKTRGSGGSGFGSGSATLLVSDALVSNALPGEELLKLVLGSGGTDGLVKNGYGTVWQACRQSWMFRKDSSLAAEIKLVRKWRKYTFMIRLGHNNEWGVAAKQECWPL